MALSIGEVSCLSAGAFAVTIRLESYVHMYLYNHLAV